MFKKIKEATGMIWEVLSRGNYLLIFLITSVLGFYVLYKLTLATIAEHSLKIFVIMSGLNYTFFNLVVLGIISLLFGIFMSLFVYKVILMRTLSKTGFFGTIGLAAGLFSAGCPTCGSVLFALFGMPLALFYLPFKGMELKVLSVVFLLFSNYFLARSFVECKVKNN